MPKPLIYSIVVGTIIFLILLFLEKRKKLREENAKKFLADAYDYMAKKDYPNACYYFENAMDLNWTLIVFVQYLEAVIHRDGYVSAFQSIEEVKRRIQLYRLEFDEDDLKKFNEIDVRIMNYFKEKVKRKDFNDNRVEVLIKERIEDEENLANSWP